MSQPPRVPRFRRLRRRVYVHRRPVALVVLAAALVAFLAWLPAPLRSDLLAGLLSHRRLLALLLVFALLSLSLLWSHGERADTRLFLYLNSHQLRRRWVDALMWIATQIGNGIVSLSAAAALYLLGDRRLAVGMTLGVLTLWLAVEALKFFTARARPFLVLAGTKVVGWRERGRSFPSGHTSQAFFLAALAIHALRLGPLGSLLLYTLAALVGFTRIYIGVHYPRDALGGAILGSVWGILYTLIDPYLSARFS